MRSYRYSIAALNTPGARYREMMLSAVPMRLLYQTYKMPLYMVIHDSFTDMDHAVDMQSLRDDCQYRSITFDQYLLDTAHITWPYLDSVPVLSTAYVRYADVFYAGYTIEREHPEGYHNETIPRDEKTWAKLTKPNVDYRRLYQTSLITVNGFFHRTDADSTALYVKDAFKSLMHSGKNTIGITNFAEVCNLTFMDYVTDIEVVSEEDHLLNGCLLNFKTDVSDKVVMFVIGGYLFYNHPAFIRHSTHGFRVRFDLMDLPNRFYEMRQYLDTQSLGVVFDEENDNVTLQSRLTSDEYIMRLLAMSQSFAIILDSDEHIFYETLPVQFDKRAPWAETYLIPDKPLATYNGRLLDYHWRYGWDNRWIVHVTGHLAERNVVNTTIRSPYPINDQLDPNDPLPVGKPSFLYIGRDI